MKLNIYRFVYLLSVITFHIGIIFTCEDHNEEELWKRVKLFAVTNYSGIEDLFIELHRLKARLESPLHTGTSENKPEGVWKLDLSENNLDIKKQICKNVFKSDYFINREEKYVNPKRWPVRSELKKNQRTLYENIFRKTDKNKYEYDNSFRIDEISVHEHTERVWVFSCLVKKGKEKTFKQYFISEEYNVSAAFYKGSYIRPITGRFVLGLDYENQFLEVKALAQQSVKTITLQKGEKFVELFYLGNKLSNPSATETLNEDPICKLTFGERLRLSAAIFSTEYFEHRYELLSTMESVHGTCEQVKISIKSYEVNRQVGKAIIKELMDVPL